MLVLSFLHRLLGGLFPRTLIQEAPGQPVKAKERKENAPQWEGGPVCGTRPLKQGCDPTVRVEEQSTPQLVPGFRQDKHQLPFLRSHKPLV